MNGDDEGASGAAVASPQQQRQAGDYYDAVVFQLPPPPPPPPPPPCYPADDHQPVDPITTPIQQQQRIDTLHPYPAQGVGGVDGGGGCDVDDAVAVAAVLPPPPSYYSVATASGSGSGSMGVGGVAVGGSSPPDARRPATATATATAAATATADDGGGQAVMRRLARMSFDCGLCGATASLPKMLPCGHAFCLNCLFAYESFHVPLVCPSCGLPGPKGDISLLPAPDHNLRIPVTVAKFIDPLHLFPPPLKKSSSSSGSLTVGLSKPRSKSPSPSPSPAANATAPSTTPPVAPAVNPLLDSSAISSTLQDSHLGQPIVMYLQSRIGSSLTGTTLSRWLSNLWLAPSDLMQRVEVVEQKELLVPFWVFSCSAETGYSVEIYLNNFWNAYHSIHIAKCYNVYACAYANPQSRTAIDKEMGDWNLDIIHVSNPNGTILEWDVTENTTISSAPHRKSVPAERHTNKQISAAPPSNTAKFLIQHPSCPDPTAFYFSSDTPPLPTAEVGVSSSDAWKSVCEPQVKHAIHKMCKTTALSSQPAYWRDFQCETTFLDVKAMLVYFPVYFLLYRYNNQTFNFRLNAQTGTVSADRPYGAGVVGAWGKSGAEAVGSWGKSLFQKVTKPPQPPQQPTHKH